jgi:hypothetical protein
VTSRSSRKPKTRKELSKADLKAYEARRADERKRIGTANTVAEPSATPVIARVEHTYAISRDDEFAVIKADLMRLLVILGVIAAIMVVLTVVLR